jgi:hypothetical protein
VEKRIHITELCSPCIMRWRGQQAYDKLEKYLALGHVEVDLDGAELLSMSFLDELVSKLVASNSLDKVTFVVNEPVVRDKLARIAGIRAISLFCRSSKQVTCRVRAKRNVSPAPVFTASKVASL